MRYTSLGFFGLAMFACTADDLAENKTVTTPTAPAYLATMTHMEGDWDFDGPDGTAKFDLTVKKLEKGMAMFREAGGVMTVESEIPFATKALELNSDIFDVLMDEGFGVGTHCDIATTTVLSEDLITEEFARRKAPMDALIGAENNLNCSGGGGRSDWIVGANNAGFKFLNGLVGFHYLAMDESERPEGWTDDYILNQGHSHDPAPVDFYERIHPFMMDDATDFEADVPGAVLANAGELGSLVGFEERSLGKTCPTNCPLTETDVALAIEAIDEALSIRDPERLMKVDVYLSLSLFKEENADLVTLFIDTVNTEFVDTGRIEWATQAEVYESYVAMTE